jgi:hypothetical protein
MPRAVVVEVQAVRSYNFMMVNGRVVLVDLATSEQVAELR